MRSLSIFIFVSLLATLLGSPDADARRRRRSSKPKAPLGIVIVPFEGKGTLSDELPEAIELELEIVESVLVKSNQKIRADLEDEGETAFEASFLAKKMKTHGVDVLVHGVEGYNEDGAEVLHIIVYGADGRARVWKTFAIPTDYDAAAPEIVEALEGDLGKFRKLKPVTLALPPPPASAAPLDDDSLFVDFDDDGKKKKKKKKKRKKKKRKKKDRDKDGKRRRLGQDRLSDDAADGKKRKRRKRLGGDAAAGDSGRRLLDDDGDDAEEGEEKSLVHIVNVSTGANLATWYYSLQATRPAQSDKFHNYVFPGASLRMDLWPIEWVGVDADIQGAVAPFRFADRGEDGQVLEEDSDVDPAQLNAYHLTAGVSLKARYVLHLGFFGIGAGMRLGYRFVGAMAEDQRYVQDKELYTRVPGYVFHTLSMGPELYMALAFLDRRLEIELKSDLLPATYYAEAPDNPGRSSLAGGWWGQAAVRMEVFYGVYAEGFASTSGAVAQFSDEGDCRSHPNLVDETGQRETVQGGRVFNIQASGGLGLGFFW